MPIEPKEGGGGNSPAFAYWQSGAGMSNITPPGNAWPEGQYFGATLCGMGDGRSVVEFGCGYGRLCWCFEPELYTGLDICPLALARAKTQNPEYEFALIDGKTPIKGGDMLLAHTVLLHIPDDDIAATVARFSQRCVVVSEILGRSWRRAGDPPVFNREASDYAEIFKAAGYRVASMTTLPYNRYHGVDLTMLEFVKGD